ncbi:MAG: hypothetical protein PHS54_05210 [Clostridia bacterium]|nr:hypothetical protein [Clostridia bacterium]
MIKESFIFGAMIGAAVGVMLYKYNSEAKKAIDKGEKMIKEKMEDCQNNMNKTTTKKQG